MHTDRLTPQAESLCGQERLYSSCSHLQTLSPEMCVYQTHTQTACQQRVLRDSDYLLSFTDAVSLLLTLHSNLMSSRWLTINLQHNLQHPGSCSVSFCLWLDDTHVRKLLFQLIHCKQSSGEGLGVYAKITIPPLHCVYFKICLMWMMFVATEIDRGTKFLSLTWWDEQYRQHCWHSCGNLQKPTPGLQMEWDSVHIVHPHTHSSESACVLTIKHHCRAKRACVQSKELLSNNDMMISVWHV